MRMHPIFFNAPRAQSSVNAMNQTLIIAFLVGSYAMSLLAGALGGAGRLLRGENRETLPPLYPGNDFPTRWDILFTAFFFGAVVLYMLFPDESPAESSTQVNIYHGMLFAIIIMAMQYLPMALRLGFLPKPLAAGDAPPPRRLRDDLKISFLTVGVTFAFSLAYEHSGLMDLIVRTTGCPMYQGIVQELQKGDAHMAALIVVAAVGVAPIGEECAFRGFLYGSLRKLAGRAAAVICSSLLFAAVHCSVAHMAPLFVFAVMQCVLYEKTKSLRAPMLAHAIFNALSCLAAFCFPDSGI